jgi:2-keto-4-pentenoate hydratase
VPLSPAEIGTLAAALAEAERSRLAIEPLTAALPELSPDDAYAIQLANVAGRRAAGERQTGWKVGLTSAAARAQFGVDEPDFGHLFAAMQIATGEPLRCADLIATRIEPEIAFRLKAPLRGPGVSATDVLNATGQLLPALEIVDSRIRDWRISLADTIADNASAARYMVGASGAAPDGFDLRLTGLAFSVDGALVATAAGAAVLGGPANAVAWLCNTLARFDQGLEAGQVVLPGSLVAPIAARPGMQFRAEFDRLGSVALTVV